MTNDMNRETPQDTWYRLKGLSTAVRERAEANSALTLPEVYPPDGESPDQLSNQTAYQSIGARGLSNLVNRVAVALFRPSTSFFRLRPTKKGAEEYLQANPRLTEADLDNSLAAMEKAAGDAWTQRGEHHKLIQALSHIFVIGQACLWFDKALDSLRVIPFAQYNIERTASGDIGTLVVAEELALRDLSKSLREQVEAAHPHYGPEDKVNLYTRWMTEDGKTYTQETSVEGQVPLEKFTKRMSKDKLPVAVPFWKLPDGASYALSLVDALTGDLVALNKLSEALVKGSVALLDYRMLVNPGGQTSVEDMESTGPGDYVPGLPGDIGVSTPGDAGALQYVAGLVADIERRLSSAFLLDQGVMRQGERVTATEVQATIQSLETQYAGMYAALAHHLQQPLARWIMDMHGLELDESLEVSIITGFDALSRANEVQNLQLALQTLAQMTQLPPQVIDRMRWETVAAFVGHGYGMDLKSFLVPEEEYQANIQRQQAQQLAMQVQAQQAVQQPPA